MTKEVEILRNAIIFELSSVALKRARACPGSIKRAMFDEVHERLFTALKEADKVRDEPVLMNDKDEGKGEWASS